MCVCVRECVCVCVEGSPYNPLSRTWSQDQHCALSSRVTENLLISQAGFLTGRWGWGRAGVKDVNSWD